MLLPACIQGMWTHPRARAGEQNLEQYIVRLTQYIVPHSRDEQYIVSHSRDEQYISLRQLHNTSSTAGVTIVYSPPPPPPLHIHTHTHTHTHTHRLIPLGSRDTKCLSSEPFDLYISKANVQIGIHNDHFSSPGCPGNHPIYVPATDYRMWILQNQPLSMVLSGELMYMHHIHTWTMLELYCRRGRGMLLAKGNPLAMPYCRMAITGDPALIDNCSVRTA